MEEAAELADHLPLSSRHRRSRNISRFYVTPRDELFKQEASVRFSFLPITCSR